VDTLTYGALINLIKAIPKGDKGDGATVTIGTVSQGDLAVENVGTETNAILNFAFPYSTNTTFSDDDNGNVVVVS